LPSSGDGPTSLGRNVERLAVPSSTVATREQVFRTRFENLGTGLEEPKGVGEPTDRVEREADREGILDLLTRYTRR
jgi:hypothetical protein